jgi:hypothetical protein
MRKPLAISNAAERSASSVPIVTSPHLRWIATYPGNHLTQVISVLVYIPVPMPQSNLMRQKIDLTVTEK